MKESDQHFQHDKKILVSDSQDEGMVAEAAPREVYVSTGGFGEGKEEINIEAALDEYYDLKQELSHISRKSSRVSGKLEEGTADQDDFNLSDFLHGMSNDQRQAGHQPKHLGVIWKNLSVEGVGAEAHTIPTVTSGIIKNLQFWKLFGFGTKKSVKIILKDLSGFCKDGEMLLLLGRPGAGCTTLLKIISNMRSSFTDIQGTVNYGGFDQKHFASKFHGQTCYNSEEDQHYPTLSTKQTLQFALRTKTPGTRLPNESKKEFIDKVLYMLGNMLGLTKQMHTMVGNAFVRGLSGGERKRLSIAEQMTTQSTINCWDCSTRGLDAASALDYVRSLRIMTDVFHKTTVATLYQASNNIFTLFDKVLLLDDGYCLYFGPTRLAKRYFEDLGFYCPPRKSIPDFLTGLCNPIEREIIPGFENSVPVLATDFQRCYYGSSIYQDMMQELKAYEEVLERENPAETFKEAMDQEHQKRAPKGSPYIASFYQQVLALTARQYYLLIKDLPSLISRYGTILIQSLIMASCFYQIPGDGNGAFSRGGAIFFSVLFNSLVSQSELIHFLMGRPVLEKHKQYALYRPSAFYVAQVIMDIPYAFAQVLLFEICAYFMMGLNLDAGRFFTFFIGLFFINMCMNGFFRMFGAVTSSFFLATQTAGVCLIAIVTYCGYVISYGDMHPWLSWIYWISPIGYGFKTLLVNEMKGQVYSCEGAGNAIPFGPGYDDWNYKVCTMAGGNPGENFVTGDSYLKKTFQWNTADLWAPDFVAVVGFFILFTLITALAMEYSDVSKVGSLTKLYIPGKAPKQRTPEEEANRLRRQATNSEKMEAISSGTTFSWQDVNYSVPIKGGSLQLLNNISGIVKPGHLTALMGSSGAGKTTLLDVLARRKTLGTVDGRLYLNGETLINDFERITGYCEQMDVHQPAVTVREALQFSANLRQPAETPQSEKDAYVEQIIELLEMEDISDAQVGNVDFGFGISVEERKRLTIGMELVGKPQLLFLDEPTSGLDAQSSFNIIRFIRKLADAGWPVLCTIHQPSAILFDHFDHLLLLVRGGRTAYHGEIGEDARIMIDYFEKNGGPICSVDANPAEYILEVVGAGTAGKARQDWADIWAASPESKALSQELEHVHEVADQNPQREALTYATSFKTQFYLVHKRMALAYWRSPDYNIGRFITIMFTSLITGFTYWKLGNSVSDLKSRTFALFASFIMANILIILAQPKFMTERMYFRREYASRYYGWIPFTVSVVLVEIPYILVLGAFFMCGFYWTAGLTNVSEAVGYFYIMLVCFVFWAVTLGFVIASVAENPVMAGVVNPLVISLFILFCGFMQPAKSMPRFWSSWMYWLNPFHYFIEGLAVNELSYIVAECSDKDLVKFLPPPGQTCGAYTQNFFSYGATGSIANPEAMQPDLCGYCAFKSGAEFYETSFGWDVANKWRNLGIVIAFFVFNVFCFGGLVYWNRKGRR
ncbi:ABC-2 type transporter-domain-containing protein [Mucor mucedo]|uniref:ABC-2 type transporter-domain-containing protein n=1 Tax=Mucor mucedo TaxID=29922 RepID=UPI00221F1397|nr:ABC-2 type transporter-domain-containing protein [Mucor mucedo]KAI7867468.1 ABC-2 type transporter-domain-containing protein [Mucor mucedo]